jgi:hypothetical protein
MKNSLHPSQRITFLSGLIQAALLITISTSSVFANVVVPEAFVGEWRVTWTGKATKPLEANLSITANGQGTWQTLTKAQNNPCVGREVPIAVTDISDKAIAVRAKFAEVINGCADVNISLQQREDKSITGIRETFELTLKRK